MVPPQSQWPLRGHNFNIFHYSDMHFHSRLHTRHLLKAINRLWGELGVPPSTDVESNLGRTRVCVCANRRAFDCLPCLVNQLPSAWTNHAQGNNSGAKSCRRFYFGKGEGLTMVETFTGLLYLEPVRDGRAKLWPYWYCAAATSSLKKKPVCPEFNIYWLMCELITFVRLDCQKQAEIVSLSVFACLFWNNFFSFCISLVDNFKRGV